MLERYKESYRSITVGDELKVKILSQAKENFQKKSRERNMEIKRSVVAMAACLTLMVGIGVGVGASGFQKTQVFYNGEKIRRREEVVTEASARSYILADEFEAKSGVPLEIKTETSTVISVTSGEVLVYDGYYDNLVFIGSEYAADKTVLLFWNLSEATEKEPVLTVENDYEKLSYTLRESEDGGYIMKLTAREKKK